MAKRPPGTLRIIGGTWRSRVVRFSPSSGLRATPDRVRQTLFDWLAPVIEGARVLDAFAGSGVLGLEALSRGADHVTFLESDGKFCATLRESLAGLEGATRATVHHGDSLAYLRRPDAGPFDVALLDPPFGTRLLSPTLAVLAPRLTPDARVFAEWGRGELPDFPEGYVVLRKKQAGQVSYALASNRGPVA